MSIKQKYEYFKNSEKLFRCPLCSNEMIFKNQNSLICRKNHCFDLSKHGYINFVPQQIKFAYSKDLFESRRVIFNEGFYEPLVKEFKDIIKKYSSSHKDMSIADIGCGEGFFISEILENNKLVKTAFALDIVKDAIVLGAKKYSNIKWIVGDLSNIPLKSSSMDILLNILSPANYTEFSRIMKNDGILIKAIPGEHYLRELRNCANKQLMNKKYSNEGVINVFNKNMLCVEKKHIFYELPVDDEILEHFIKMTPMLINVEMNRIDLSMVRQITIDIEIITGIRMQ